MIPSAVQLRPAAEDAAVLTRELRTYVLKPPEWAAFSPGNGFRHQVTRVRLVFGRDQLVGDQEQGTEVPPWVLAEVMLWCPDPLIAGATREVWISPRPDELPHAVPWPEWLAPLVDAYLTHVTSSSP